MIFSFIDSVIKESNKDIKNSDSLKILIQNKYTSDIEKQQSNYKFNRVFYMNYFHALQLKLGVDRKDTRGRFLCVELISRFGLIRRI